MKKKYITCAGIVAALILVGMFVGICLSTYPFPYLSPSITLDPVTDRSIDENNMMTLTGRTTLQDSNGISITVSAAPGSGVPGNGTGRTEVKSYGSIFSGEGGSDRWEGTFDISVLQPGDYTVTLASWTLKMENHTFIKGDPITAGHFMLGNENSGPGTVRKKTRVIPPYIRINTGDRNPAPVSLRITGTTNLAPDSPLAWNMQPVTDGTGSPEYQGMVMVMNGTEGVNRWAVLLGNGTPEAGRYRFNISAGGSELTPSADVFAASEFEIPASLTPLRNMTGSSGDARDFITIDTPPDLRVDNIYTITGTTSLPAGEHLQVEVIPASFETNYNFTIDASETSRNRTLSGAAVFSGSTSMVDVVNGSGGENLWAFRLETYVFSPGLYLVNVSNEYLDDATRKGIPGNLSHSRIISIGGDGA